MLILRRDPTAGCRRPHRPWRVDSGYDTPTPRLTLVNTIVAGNTAMYTSGFSATRGDGTAGGGEPR